MDEDRLKHSLAVARKMEETSEIYKKCVKLVEKIKIILYKS